MNNPNDLFSTFGKKNAKNEQKRCQFEDPWLMVRDWYASELGQALLQVEKQFLNNLLEQIFGYNLVQLGCLCAEDSISLLENVKDPLHSQHLSATIFGNNSRSNIEAKLDTTVAERRLISKSKISGQFIFESLSQVIQLNSATCINTRFDDLPVKSQSIDVVILPHTLEFEQNPHQILREVERVLVAEGKAIILGFNPMSLWGLWHKYWEMKDRITRNSSNRDASCHAPLPSCGHLISQKRLRDWLQLLGFDVDLVKEYFYRPPLRSSAVLKKLQFIERAGQFSKILPPGGYLMVATKRVSTLTPIPQGWKLSDAFISSEASEPSAGFKKKYPYGQ